jgi:hypothetical protein
MRLSWLLPALFLASCTEEPRLVNSLPGETPVAVTGKLHGSLALARYMPELVLQDSDFETCEEAEARAKADTAAGILRYYTFGYPADMCSYNLWHSLVNSYGIEAHHLGCVVYGWESCYDDVMAAAIEKKYGKDFWKTINRRVDSACSARREANWPQQRLPQVEIVTYLEPMLYCAYRGPQESFGEYVGTFLRLPRSEKKDSLRRAIWIRYDVDSTGKLISWKFAPAISGDTDFYDTLSPTLERRLHRAVRRASRKAKWKMEPYNGKREGHRGETVILVN